MWTSIPILPMNLLWWSSLEFFIYIFLFWDSLEILPYCEFIACRCFQKCKKSAYYIVTHFLVREITETWCFRWLTLRNRHLQTVQNIFILNLAIGDVLMCLTSLPITPITNVYKTWFFASPVCKLIPLVQVRIYNKIIAELTDLAHFIYENKKNTKMNVIRFRVHLF